MSRAKGTCSKSEGRLKHLRSVDDSEEVLLFCCLSVGGFYITTRQIWFGLSLHFIRWCFGKKTVALHPFMVPRIISRALFFQLAFFKRMVRCAIFYPLPQNFYLFAFSYISKPLVERRWYWTTWCSQEASCARSGANSLGSSSSKKYCRQIQNISSTNPKNFVDKSKKNCRQIQKFPSTNPKKVVDKSKKIVDKSKNLC